MTPEHPTPAPAPASAPAAARYRLAACAEMLHVELPLLDRVGRLDAAGFEVELWGWEGRDLAALAATGATFSSVTGYLRGDLVTAEGADELVATARRSLDAAAVLDSPRLNLHGTGLGPDGLPVTPGAEVDERDRRHAIATLRRIAELGEEAGRVFTLENLNTAVDHPGTPFARAADTIDLVEAVGSPALRLNLDLYHAQIGEGNLTELVRRALPLVGEIQIADVPGRCEPGTGEIRYEAIAAELRALGYAGVVALEGWASGDADAALAAFRAAFA